MIVFSLAIIGLSGIRENIYAQDKSGYHLGPQLVPTYLNPHNSEEDIFLSTALESNCENSNFSTGTWKGWDGCFGEFYKQGGQVYLEPCIMAGFHATRHVLKQAPGRPDHFTCDSLITVYPGEAFSARLGDTAGGGHAEQLKYEVSVTELTYLFVYRYAVVLESPNHVYNEQPGFSVEIQDSLGNVIDSVCGFYLVYAPNTTPPPPPPPGWHFCDAPGTAGIYWKNWTTVGLNLTPYYGQTIRIVFTTHGCCYSIHRGYAYLSAYCSYLTLETALCEGDTVAILTAPPGFLYEWNTVNGDTTITGDTTQSITVPNPVTGSTYYCTLTAVNGCEVTISQTLTYTVIHTNFTAGPACAGLPTQFTDSSYVSQNNVVDWDWDFGDGTLDTLGNPNPEHIFAEPGSYEVKLVSYSTEGCYDSITKTIQVDSLPYVANDTMTKTICSNDSTNILLTGTVSGTQFTWTSYSGNPLITGYTQNISQPDSLINDILINEDSVTDTVTYVITPKKFSCEGPDTNFHVLVKPVPKLTNPVLIKSICDSGYTDIILQRNHDSVLFTWTCAASPDLSGYSENLTSPDTVIDQQIHNSGLAVDTVYYHVTPHAMTCDGETYTFKVAVYPRPNLINDPKRSSICHNTSPDVFLASDITGTTFTWTCTAGSDVTGWSDNSTPTTLLDQVLYNTSAQSDSVIYHMTPEANGCPGTVTDYTVIVYPLPVPGVTGSQEVCLNSVHDYHTAPGMSGYVWGVTGGTILTGSGTCEVSVRWDLTGLQALSLSYTDTNGCDPESPTEFAVTVLELPVPTISGSDSLCLNTSADYATESGMTDYEWNVSPGGTITAGNGTNTISVLWNGSGIQTLNVTYIDTSGCEPAEPTMKSIRVKPLPVPSISGPPAVCQNSSGSYTTDPGMTGYAWTVTGGSIASGNGTESIAVTWNILGIQSVSISYTDGNGCTATVPTIYPVTVMTLPVPTITGSDTLCDESSVIYYTEPEMISYSWNVSSGGIILSGEGTDSITVQWMTPGPQTVSVNYFAGTGCTAANPTVKYITIHPLPVPIISGPDPVCEFSTHVYSSPQFPGHSYHWTVTGGIIQSGQGTASITVQWGAAGNDTIFLSENITTTGCSAPAIPFLVTKDPYPLAAGTIAGPPEICENSTSIEYAIPAILYASSYSWSFSGTGVSITNNGNSIKADFSVGATSGSFSVYGRNHCGPGPASSLGVVVHPLPIVSHTTCNDPITLTTARPFRLKGAIPPGGTYSGPGVNGGVFTPGNAGPGMHTITYSYINTWSCNDSVTFTISVITGPVFSCNNMLTDVRDNQQYATISIGSQCWLAMNLNYGTIIPSAAMQRDNCIPERYCFGDITANCTAQGGLYQWDEMMQYTAGPGSQGLCPPGWHVPSENEWNALFAFFNGPGFAGDPMKSTGYSGFDAFLWGARHQNASWDFNNFATMFWSSTSIGLNKAWAHGMNFYDPSVSWYPGSRAHAFQVRCVRD